MGTRLLPAGLLPALLLLAAPAAAQDEGKGGGPPPVASMGGLWEVSIQTSVFGIDGTLQTRVKTRGLIEFTDLPGTAEILTLEATTFPTGFGLSIFPRTVGLRFLDYFVIKGLDAEFAGTVKVDKNTFAGRSFRATGTLLTSSAVTVCLVKGKRKPGSTSKSSIFFESFEAGLGPYVETDAAGAPAATLWHAEGSCAPGLTIPAAMGASAAAYNQGDLGLFHYDTGGANSGALQGPPIAVPSSARGVLLVFDVIRQVEGGSFFDQTWVDLRGEDATGWSPLCQTLNIAQCGVGPQTVTVGLGKKSLKALGSSFRHRFRFDTVDAVDNLHPGWYVDNVRVETVERATSN